jgi:hypothetical protein
MRVASSDWWPSRMVVSVTSTWGCARIHWRIFRAEFVELLLGAVRTGR